MSRKRRVSYLATARLSVVGGATAIVVQVLLRVPRVAMPAPLESVLGTIGVVAWFFGTAAGVLSLGTPYRRLGTVGLALSGLAVAALILGNIVA